MVHWALNKKFKFKFKLLIVPEVLYNIKNKSTLIFMAYRFRDVMKHQQQETPALTRGGRQRAAAAGQVPGS
jgi:hypothetical protein